MSSHDNAFDVVRVGAALWVLFSHAHAFFGIPEPSVFSGHTNVAVDVFFALSGYLVTQSWERDPHVGRFLLKRTLRIFPGLVICLLFTALVVGLLATTSGHYAYLRSAVTWQYIYSNVGLGFFWFMPFLPGVFEENVYPNAVNGSLWTLRYEVSMYLLLGLLGSLGAALFGVKAVKRLCLLAFAVFIFWAGAIYFGGQPADKLGVPIFWRIGLDARLALLGLNFFAGCCLYLYRDRIRLNSWLAASGLIIAAALPYGLIQSILMWLFVPYATIVFAWNAPAILKSFKNFDYSYGIYIYAFPLQQLVTMHAHRQGWNFMLTLACSTILTVLVAAISWHWIESPALKLKPRANSAKGARAD